MDLTLGELMNATRVVTFIPAALLLIQGVFDTTPDIPDATLRRQVDSMVALDGAGEALSDTLIGGIIDVARWLQAGKPKGAKIRATDLVGLLPALGRLVQGVLDSSPEVDDDLLIEQLDEMVKLTGIAEMISDLLIRGVVKVGRWAHAR